MTENRWVEFHDSTVRGIRRDGPDAVLEASVYSLGLTPMEFERARIGRRPIIRSVWRSFRSCSPLDSRRRCFSFAPTRKRGVASPAANQRLARAGSS